MPAAVRRPQSSAQNLVAKRPASAQRNPPSTADAKPSADDTATGGIVCRPPIQRSRWAPPGQAQCASLSTTASSISVRDEAETEVALRPAFSQPSRRRPSIEQYRSYGVVAKASVESDSLAESKGVSRGGSVAPTVLDPPCEPTDARVKQEAEVPSICASRAACHSGAAAVATNGRQAPGSSMAGSSMAGRSMAAHFAAVGHYQCECGLPLFSAQAKCRSLGGNASFVRYFQPSLQLELQLAAAFSARFECAKFVARCTSCKATIGAVPLDRCDVGEESDDQAHVMRVSAALKYNGAKAPPEFSAMETLVLAAEGGVEDDRKGCSAPQAPGRVVTLGVGGVRRGSQRSAHVVEQHTSSTDENSDDSSDDSDAEDDALWGAMRHQLRK